MNREQHIKASETKGELYSKKNQLKSLDYKLLKFMDGDITAEEYEPFKQKRAQLRAEIRQLEAELQNEN